MLLGPCSLAAPLFSQTLVDVTSNAGDESSNSLGWAVTTLNASGDGAISFDPSVGPITLTQPLSMISPNVTFQGADLNLAGQDDPGSQLLFQNSFTQQNNLNFQNNGGFGAGLDASVTALAWNMASTVYTNINGGNAGSTVATGGLGIIGQNGGSAFVTVGFWTAQDSAILTAGTGGSVTDTNGMGDVGGTGGSVGIVGTSLTFSGAQMILNAGSGGSATDLGSGAPAGGNGGSASVSYGSISLGFGNFGLNGGAGGSGVTGGAGGQSGAVLGSLYISGGSHFDAQGGLGGNGVSFGGSGGDASVSVGSLTVYSGLFGVEGGAGAYSGLSGGNGGGAFVAGGGLTFSSSTVFNVKGGQGGNSSGPALGGLANGGNGGNAGVSLVSLSMASGSNFNLISGNGGSGGSGSAPGAGGQGGNTSLTIGTYSISGPTQFSSGSGGSGGDSTTGSTGGSGGVGGGLSVTMGNLTLNSGADLQLNAGNGGSGGNADSGGNGGTGGNGGNVSFNAGSVSLIGTSSTSLVIVGGSGGSGGAGDVNGAAGVQGQAFASIGDLEGLGNLNVNGSTALLQISSGNFSGNIFGDETLQKTGVGTLTLSGNNTYVGGTLINVGLLRVDTGGSLGSGSVTNNALLNYIDSATAGNAVIVNNSGLDFYNSSMAGEASIINNSHLNFMDISTAGSATITTNNGGEIDFYTSASGGTARFILNGTGSLDISGETESSVTVGSVEGSGSVSLGENNLTVGSNNLNTSLLGIIADGGNDGGTSGSLSKIGIGTLTLSGANSYTGGTLLEAGALAFGNAQALGLGGVVVNGGTLESAGSPIALLIWDNYRQGPGATLSLGLGGSQAAYYDTISVKGNVSLNGTLNLYSYGGLTMPPLGNLIYVLSSSGTLMGTFQQIEENLGDIRLLPLYYNNGVELESIVPSFLALSSTPNQKAIGADLDSNVFNPKLMGMMSQLGALSGGALQTAENQVSPEGLSSFFQAGFESARFQETLVNERLYQLKADVDQMINLPGFSQSGSPLFAGNLTPFAEFSMGQPKGGDDWSGFVSGNGGFFNVAGNSNAAGYQVATYGLTGAGADYRLSKHAAIGLLAGYGHTSVTLNSGGTLSADGGQLGLYGLYSAGGFYADALVEGGLNQYNTLRTAYVGTASGTTQGQEISGAMELGYGWKQGKVSVGPLGSLQFTQVNINGFSEQGSFTPLTFPNQEENSLVSQLGVRADGRWKWGTTNLSPMITLTWEHEYNYQGGTLQAGFGAGDSFTVAGPPIGQDGVLAGAGLGVAFSKEFSVTLNYQGELGRANLVSNQFGGGAQIGF